LALPRGKRSSVHWQVQKVGTAKKGGVEVGKDRSQGGNSFVVKRRGKGAFFLGLSRLGGRAGLLL